MFYEHLVVNLKLKYSSQEYNKQIPKGTTNEYKNNKYLHKILECKQ